METTNLPGGGDDASARLTGYNHLALFVRDMDEALEFYCGVLGLKVIKTIAPADLPDGRRVGRMYFCEFGDGAMIGLCVYDAADPPAAPIFPGTYMAVGVEPLWPGGHGAPDHPQKVDHISFNVRSRADVEWFRQRLLDNGVEVSDIVDYLEPSGAGWLISIYFFDPFGNPLEISTLDLDDPDIEKRLRRELWFADPEPVAALEDAR